MNLKPFCIAAAITCIALNPLRTTAQKLVYKTAGFPMSFAPSLEIDKKVFKTFDFKLLTRSSLFDTDNSKAANSKVETNKYMIDFIGMQQLETPDKSADFHIVVFFDQYAGQNSYIKSGGVMNAEVSLTTIITTANGNTLYTKGLTKAATKAEYGKDVELDEVTRMVIQNAINTSIVPFQNKLTGYKAEVGQSIAFIEADKKHPEYKVTEDQMKTLLPILRRDDVAGFCAVAEGYMPSWEQFLNNASGEEADDVKRMAYQNMALYYILSGNIDKAKTTLELYRPIDKPVSNFLGAIKTTESKYKNSVELEKLITSITPNPEKLAVVDAGKKITVDEVISKLAFESVTGTITIDDKKRSGAYTGVIRFPKISPIVASGGNIADLDAPDLDVYIKANDGTNVKTTLSKVQSLKGADGKNYVVQKVTSIISGNSLSLPTKSYSLMQEVYVSPKISLFRVLIPVEDQSGSSFMIRKTNDEKGVRTSMFNAKKNIGEYLSDCPKAAEMVANSKSLNTDIQGILEMYTSCSN